MAENNFIIDLIASLKKSQSKEQVREDAKNLGDIKIPLVGTLNKTKTRAQLKQDLASLNSTVNLTGKVDKKGITASVQQATQQAQKKAGAQPIEVNLSVKKDKLVNDIKLLGQQNSRLFKDAGMSQKYARLLDSAQLADSAKELNSLRLQLGAFRSELKVTGNSGMTMTDALKRGFSKVLQLFGGYGLIMRFTAQLRNAWKEAVELDSAMTDLSRVNSEISRSGFPEYLDKVISRTKELAVATKDYIDAMTTFSRAGYSLADSETLADMAVQLEHVGDMGAEAASKALLSGLQGYDKIDGYGMDQLAEKAQALNDKIDLIGNTASISQEEVASGIQAVGSVMSDANTSVDEFIAMLGAGNRAVQDSNKVALAIRTSALRIRGCTVELQEMGEETDGVIESTSTLAEKIKALTNMDGNGGVDILEADEETFRSIFDIYNDISKVYSKMSDTDASALLELIAGKQRSNQVSSILGNMAEANELLNRSLNAAGTASNEYQIYLDSAKASTERFGVAMAETYNNVINGETVKGLANAGTAVLDFANSCGILEGTLKGFLALGILKGIAALTVAFKNSAVQASNFGAALNTVKHMETLTAGTARYANKMNKLQESCIGLTDAQLKQVLASEALEESDRIAILTKTGLTEAEAQAKLAKMGLIQSTNAQTAANEAATASTFKLSAAVKGFGASVKAAFLSNPVGIAVLGISTLVGVATSAISKSNQKAGEAIQKAKEAADVYKEASSSVNDYASKYKELREQLLAAKGNEEETYNVKRQLLELQSELNDKFGEEYSHLNLVTDAYKDQTDAIKELNKESANKFLNENRGGIEEAENKMDSDNTYHLGTMGGMVDADELVLLDQISQIADSNGIGFTGNGFQFVGGAEEAAESINNFMDEIKLLQKESGNVSKVMAGIFDGILDNSGDALSDAKNIISEYGGIYNQAKMAQIASDDSLSNSYNEAVSAVEAYSEAILRSEDPYNDENVNKAWNELQMAKQLIGENEAEWEKYSGIMDNVFSAAKDDVYSFYQTLQNDGTVAKLAEEIRGLSDIDLQAMADDGNNGDVFDKLYEKAENYGLKVQDIIDLMVELGYVQGKIEESSDTEPPSLPFDEAWASLDSIEDSDSPMKDLKESLLELAEAGQLTIETFNEAEGSGDFLKQLGLDPDKTVEIEDFLYKINELKSSADQLSSMRKGITSLSENLYSKKEEPKEAITADVFSGMDNALKAQAEEWENYVSVLGNASSSIDDVQRVTDSLATAYINSNNFLANLTDSNKDYYISQLASMGVDNAEEIVQQSLAEKIQIHQLKLRALEIAKDGVNTKTRIAISNLLDEAGATDTVRYAIIDCIIQEQIFANTNLNVDAKISQLGRLISEYYGVAAAASYANMVTVGNDGTGTGGAQNSHETVSPEQAYKNIKNQYEKPAEVKAPKINTGGYSGGSRNSGSGGGSGSGSSSKPTPETFDFIEIAISRIEAAIDRMKAKAEATFLSLKSRAKSYDKAIAKVTEEINLQTKAYSAYMAKANSFGLEAGYAAQVRDGSINIEDISDDGLKERIKNYQEWYEKALDCQEAIRELKDTQRELLQEKIEAYVTKYDQILSRLESVSTRIQNSMDMKEAWGSQASAKDYKKLNRNMLSQVHNTILQRKKLLELRATVKKNTEAWREYNERVGESNTSIQELTKSMAENAIAQAALAKAKADRKNEGEDTADERLDTRLSTASSTSVKNRLINAKAKNIDQRQNNLKAAYASSKSSRAKLGSKIQKASQKNVSKKNKGLFQKAIKCVKSKKLVGTSTINAIANAMKSAKGREYTALNSLLSYCNSYNAYKNAEDENRLAYEMYALTAQAEKKSLREEQLQNKLDNRQAIADRAATSIAETASAKNRNANIQASLAEGNAKIYANMRKLAASDRKKAAKKANFYSGKEYKKATGKLKTRLKKAASAIKSGKKITSDGLKAIKEYCTKYLNGNLTYYYNCMAYNEAVENEISAKDAETIANVEAYATRLQTKIDNAGNTVSSRDTQNELYEATAKNQKTAGAKNKYVDLRASNISKNLATYKSLYDSLSSSFNTMKGKISSAKGSGSASNAIISEVKKYTAKEEFIPQSLITKAYTVSDSFGRACEKYNESLEARNVAKETYGLYKETSKTELASLAAEKMENIDREYGNKMAVHTQKATQLNNAIDLAQAKGYQASKAYYGKLYNNEEDRNALLTQKRAELVKSLSESVQNGSIEKYTDEWYDLVGQIDDVTNALDESTLSLEEYKNQMRQIEWDNFEYLEGRISDTISEMDFMINELSRQGLTSDKTGSLTDAGRSVAMLHAMNYNVYGQQAEDYAEQARKIDRELAKDPYNKTLIDQKREYIKAMQDATKSAEDEKYAIIDLYKQGYEALIAKVRDLISEYSGLLDAEKDAFDYNNNITDKAKEIASLRKQLEAYAGDVSEETRAKVQTLKVSLEDAEKDLQETQYDKYISDTKDMLSDLGDDFEDAIQELIDNLHLEFDKLIKDINSNAATSTSTIMGKMSGIGYLGTEEVKALLSEINKAGDGTGDKVGAAANGIVDGIKDSQKDMQDAADKNAGATNTGTAASEIPDREDGKPGSSKPTPTFVPLPAGTGSLTTSEEALKALHKDEGGTEKEEPKLTDPKQAGDTFVMVEDRQANITKAELDAKAKKAEQKAYALDYIKRHVSATKKEYSTFTDLNKKVYSNFGGKVLSTKEMKELAAGLGVKYDNAKSTGALYKKLKSLGVKGFRAGSRHIPYSQLAFLGEGVNELQFDKSQGVLKEVGQGDKVFTGRMAENLWKVASADPSVLLGGRSLKQDIVPVRTGNGVGDVNISFGDLALPDVTDSAEFAKSVKQVMRNAMCYDHRTRKCVTEAVSAQILGRGKGMAVPW